MNTLFKLLLTLFICFTNTPTILCMDTLESFFEQLGLPGLIQHVAQKPETHLKYDLPYLITPFEPHIQPNNPDLIKKRISCQIGKFTDTFSNCEIIPRKCRSGICFTRAIEHALDLPADKFEELRPVMLGNDDLFTILKVLKFFEQKEKAEPNASVFYISSQQPNVILHAGWVKRIETDGKIIIQSKFGIDNEYITGLFEIPLVYGDIAFFCTLKKEFTDKASKDYIFSTLQRRVAESKTLQLKFGYIRQLLFQIVNAKSPKLETTTVDIYMAAAIKESHDARNALERYPIIDINMQDSKGNSVLMLAAANGKYSVIKTFLNYGADHSLKNKRGLTAVDLANKNNHNNIANFILNYTK